MHVRKTQYYTQERVLYPKKTQITEQTTWCAREEREEQTRHAQSNEGDCIKENDQKGACREYTPEEQWRIAY